MGWILLAVAVGLVASAIVLAPICLRRQRERITSLWDDIYFVLVQRRAALRQLALAVEPEAAQDMDRLFSQMETTSDPITHAALQNSLLPMLEAAVQRCQRDKALVIKPGVREAMDALRVADAKLAPMRDRFNRLADSYNEMLERPPFSLTAVLTHAREQPLFPMELPWWSTNADAYGAMDASDIVRLLSS